MTPLLPYDVCRCHADRCPLSSTCLRYLDRDLGEVHAATLKNEDGTCFAYIPQSSLPIAS